MKWSKASEYHDESECGRYILAVAHIGDGLVTYFATRRFRGSHVIGIERGLHETDEAACADARVKLRRLCTEDAATLGAEL